MIERVTEEANRPTAIVGVGASAGGVEALEQFFKNVPSDTGIAFVLIMRGDSAGKGYLPEILRRFTSMPVLEARDGVKVEANTVYVKPTRSDLTIFHGTIWHLEPIRMPVDRFFQHLAGDQGEKAIGIVLSGTGSDGSLGIRAIKERMGMVMAEDPSSARVNGMPRSAIATELVDYSAPAGDLPALLVQYVKYSAKVPAGEVPTTARMEMSLKEIFSLIRLQSGQNFSKYKQNTVKRRIERRMALHQIPGIGEYVTFLHKNPQEVDALARDLLIGVTRFFRDPEAWAVLKEEILKDLLPKKPRGKAIRAWCVGCSTGEEAYSLAIVLRECLDALGRTDAIQIFATDVDARAIEVARRGTYPANIATALSFERLDRFFVREGNTYRVQSEIRECVVFATQNILSDPPFTHLDILSCRNLLIYLSAELQKQVIPLFQYALNAGGLLFLGTAESISGYNARFRTIDGRWKIFQRRPGVSPQVPKLEMPATVAKPVTMGKRSQKFVKEEKAATALAREWLLARYIPSVVIVNEDGDILYFHGWMGKYLDLSHGAATLNISMITQPEIQSSLRSMLQTAVLEQKDLIQRAALVNVGDRSRQILLEIRPVRGWAGRNGILYVVTFQDDEKLYQEGFQSEGDYPAEKISSNQFQYTIEDMQISQKELQRANEELTNSREELQSLNEELLTINTEYQKKIEELSGSNDDMRNFLQITDIAMLFLNNDLGVRRFTEPIQSIINLQAGDIGRPITDLAVNLRDRRFSDDVRGVLKTQQAQKKQVQTMDGRWFEMRISPYRTAENRVFGVLVTFIDINQCKDLESSVRQVRTYIEEIMAITQKPLLVLDTDLRIISANFAFYKAFDVTPEEAEGNRIYTLKNWQWNIPRLQNLFEEILPELGEVRDFLIEHDFSGTGRRMMRFNARKSDAGPGWIFLAIQIL